MTLNGLVGFQIKKEIYDIFGGRNTKQKKRKQKRKPKSKSHLDYSKFKLNPINTETMVPNAENKNQSNQVYQPIKRNPSNVTTEHAPDRQPTLPSTDPTNEPTLPITTTVQDNINDLQFDPFQQASPSPSSASESTNSTSFEYHYHFDDLNTIGMINTPQFSAVSDCDIEDNITPPPYLNFTMNNIGPIGAITTSQFTALSAMRKVEEQEEIKFMNNRSIQISQDLSDLLGDTDDNDGAELITDLLEIYDIYDNEIYKYFDKLLQIYYLNELTNMDPDVIIKPLVAFNVKQLIQMNKFAQLISHQICENPSANTGKVNNKWITLNENKFHKIYQSKSPCLLSYKFTESKAIMDDNEIIELRSMAEHNETFEYKTKQTIKLGVIQLPDFSRHDPSLFSFGITINGHNVSINDRLSIFYNNTFISNIGNGQFIENDDDITIEIFMSGKTCNVNFSSVFTDNIQIEMDKPFTFGIFVKQNNGTGLYSINMY